MGGGDLLLWWSCRWFPLLALLWPAVAARGAEFASGGGLEVVVLAGAASAGRCGGARELLLGL